MEDLSLPHLNLRSLKEDILGQYGTAKLVISRLQDKLELAEMKASNHEEQLEKALNSAQDLRDRWGQETNRCGIQIRRLKDTVKGQAAYIAEEI